MPDGSPVERGCLLLADVSGYTSYLMGSELEHAHDILEDLMGTLVEHVGKVFTVNELEGDAVFAYGLDDRLTPAMALDTVDETYFAFMARRRNIGAATSCRCNACVRIPDLDLKFVVHHGSFIRKSAPGRETLTGGDVIIAHRLLKNSVAEDLGLRGYALMTSSAVESFGLDPAALGYPHTEHYDDVGTIEAFVADLEARWRDEQERRRFFVSSEDAKFVFEDMIPAAPTVVWEYLTSPLKRPLWQGGVLEVDQDNAMGRPGVGTVNHCVHGKDAVTEEILDWRPFDYYTVRAEIPKLGKMVMTTELRQEADGTGISVRIGETKGALTLLRPMVFRKMRADLTEDGKRLLEVLRSEEALPRG